jgi:hypothetical protein
MVETPLLGQSADFVIGAPEVTNQNTLEESAQDLFDHGRSPTLGDPIIAERGGREPPEPMGDPVESPTRFVRGQDSTLGDFLTDFLIKRLQQKAQRLPRLGQASWRDLEAGEDGDRFDQVIDTDSCQVMKPGRQDHQSQSNHGIGQGIGERCRNNLFTPRAPITIDRMLGHRRVNRWKIFGIPMVSVQRLSQRGLTIRAMI